MRRNKANWQENKFNRRKYQLKGRRIFKQSLFKDRRKRKNKIIKEKFNQIFFLSVLYQ